jgi:adenylate cyclase
VKRIFAALLEIPATLLRFLFDLIWKILSRIGRLGWRVGGPIWEKVQPFVQARPGLAFASLSIFITIILFGSRMLSGFDDDLLSLIYQAGYKDTETNSDIILVKKDEKTSSILKKAISRRDFASIIRLVSQGRRIIMPTTDGSDPISKLKVVELKIGLLKNGDVGPFYMRSLYPDMVSPDPDGLTFFSFFEQVKHVFTDLLIPVDLFPKIPVSLDAAKTTEFGPGKNPVLAFADNLSKLGVTFQMRIFPKPTIPLQLSVSLFVDRTVGFDIPPAAVIGWDIMLQDEMKEEEDNLLVEALTKSQAPIVLGAQVEKSSQVSRSGFISTVSEADPKVLQKVETVEETVVVRPHAKFTATKTSLGLINISPDSKSFVTKVPLFHFIPEQNLLLPSFGLKVAVEALDQKLGTGKGTYARALEKELQRLLPLVREKKFTGGFKLLDRHIPTDTYGNMYLYFTGATQNRIIKSVSAVEAFDEEGQNFYQAQSAEPIPEFKPLNLKDICMYGFNYGDKIVLFGTFEKTDFDFYPTPMTFSSPMREISDQLMGIEIHANAIDNIMNNRYRTPPNAYHTIVLMIVLCLIQGVVIDRLTSLSAGLLSFGLLGAAGWCGFYLFHTQHQIFLVSPFFVSLPLTWCMSAILNEIRERQRANMTKGMFQRFVAPDVVQFLIDNPEKVAPGGQKKELSIFFSDLAGFTTISESLTPEKLVELMNEYLGEMTEILFKHGGTLDKYIGDAIMAYWNFPKDQSDHAIRACLYTLECHERLAQLQKDWANRGLPKAYARAGINTSKVVVGCMGSGKVQMNFTCLGDGVNLASRLEGANKEYGTLYMISDSTYQQAKDHIVSRFLDFLAVKGKKEPVKVHHLVGVKGKEPPGWNELFPLYQKGIDLHLERKWNPAIACFEEILLKWPEDGPSKTYLNRCFEYKENPPPENWDGSYHLTHK